MRTPADVGIIENKTLRTKLAKQVVAYAVEISEPLHDYDWCVMTDEIIDGLYGAVFRDEVR